MTTKVIIEVPEGAKHSAQVRTETTSTVSQHTVWPGEKFELYVYPGMRITEIKETPF